MTKPPHKDNPKPYQKEKGKPYYRDNAFLLKFGANLKKIRMGKGFSQEELANELGFSQPHLANIETGKVNCSVSHAAAIARTLGVDVKELFDFGAL